VILRGAPRRLAVAAAALAALGACGPPGAPPPRVEAPPPASASASAAPAPPAAGGAVAARVLPRRAARGWLRVEGAHLVDETGGVFAGRGANLHDTRSCDACSFEPPRVDEVLRRADALVDDWGADFVRLLLEAYPPDPKKRRVHHASAADDDAYLADVVRIVRHLQSKAGTYVLLSVWHDPSLGPTGLPTAGTTRLWQRLAAALRDDPGVLFGLVNEPRGALSGADDADVWERMNALVAAIRAVEGEGKRHVVVVQATREWGRWLDYYLEHPITAGGGRDVAYETHVYNARKSFDAILTRPARALPVIVGEVGPVAKDGLMSLDDAAALLDLASDLHVPWLAYTFHFRCPPNLLVEPPAPPGKVNVGCGAGIPLEPTAWGRMVRDRIGRR